MPPYTIFRSSRVRAWTSRQLGRKILFLEKNYMGAYNVEMLLSNGKFEGETFNWEVRIRLTLRPAFKLIISIFTPKTTYLWGRLHHISLLRKSTH